MNNPKKRKALQAGPRDVLQSLSDYAHNLYDEVPADLLAIVKRADAAIAESKMHDIAREVDRHRSVQEGLYHLREARACFRESCSPKTLSRVRLAISSAKGAARSAANHPRRSMT